MSSKWWNGLSAAQKKAHIKKHPNSVYAKSLTPTKRGVGRRVLDFWNKHPTASALTGIVGAKAGMIMYNSED